ncbi:Tyrosine-protein kinase [Dirofilaria immitis]|nr:Tyrosine-protein kinase [Dirofilaria immitis]
MGGGNLEEEDYYHGLLPREDKPHLLINEGDFLIRLSEITPNQPRQMRHIMVQQNAEGKYVTDARGSFVTVPELIQSYRNCGVPILSTVGSVSFDPVLLSSERQATGHTEQFIGPI